MALVCAAIKAPPPPARLDDPQLHVCLRGLKVVAVFTLHNEVLACLGEARLSGALAGYPDQECLSLTWRCTEGRSATPLVGQLNIWEAAHTPLQLLASAGRSAVLMEDEHHWLRLPELSGSVSGPMG